MAKKSKTSGSAGLTAWPAGPDGQFDTLGEMTGKNFEIAQTAGQAMLKGAVGMSQEMGAFVTARMKKDVEAAQTLAGCRSFSDACRMQAEFFGDAMRDYADQSSRIFQMGANAAADTVEAVARLEPAAELAEMAQASGAPGVASSPADAED